MNLQPRMSPAPWTSFVEVDRSMGRSRSLSMATTSVRVLALVPTAVTAGLGGTPGLSAARRQGYRYPMQFFHISI